MEALQNVNLASLLSGIGFLGAGVIIRQEGNVQGINTAATLWGSAAVGACAEADQHGPRRRTDRDDLRGREAIRSAVPGGNSCDSQKK